MHAESGDPASMRSDRAARWLRLLILMAIAAPALLSACGSAWPTAPGSDPANVPPPVHDSEGVIALDTPLGRAAAELVADPDEIAPTGRVVLRVVNRGDLPLTYGRPIMVERWDGQAWAETDESRKAAWTMELIIVQARESGIEQRWPFLDGRDPEPGWYRFTKSVQTEDTTGDPAQFVVRARVHVVER